MAYSDKVSDKEKAIEVLQIIADDCEKDVIEYDGKPLNGKTVAEIHGILQAKVERLALIMKDIIEGKYE